MEEVWLQKEVTLKTEAAHGRVDYVLAEHFDILEMPIVCLAEAKKDDFEKWLNAMPGGDESVPTVEPASRTCH